MSAAVRSRLPRAFTRRSPWPIVVGILLIIGLGLTAPLLRSIPDQRASLRACAEIVKDAERLICYDRVARERVHPAKGGGIPLTGR
jgi:hypothetical protein